MSWHFPPERATRILMATVSTLAADAPARPYHREAGIMLAATSAVLALAYGPSLVAFFLNQWQRPHYQHFPFILGAFAWLLWTRLGEATPRLQGGGARTWFSGAVLSAAWVAIALAAAQGSPWLAAVSASLVAAWGFLRMARQWRVTYLWAIWLVLLLVIPPPLASDQTLISFLQRVSSRMSSFVLDWVGVLHVMDGNVLSLLDKQFFVDEACSGIISVTSIIACALIFGVWQNRPPFHLLLVILAGIAWATIMNVFRICTIAVAFDKFDIDWSAGTSHEMLSLAIFTFTFLGLVSTDLALVAALAPITEELETHSGAEPRFGGWLIRMWDALQEWRGPSPVSPERALASARQRLSILRSSFTLSAFPLGAFALVAGLQAYQVAIGFGPAIVREVRHLDQALAIDDKTLPAVMGPFRLTSFEKQTRGVNNKLGEHSRLFQFKDERDRLYLVSCDFPFGPGWHDLRECYLGVGWELTDSNVTLPAKASQQTASKTIAIDPTWEFMDARFRKSGERSGYFAYSMFTDKGDPANPPYGSLLRSSLSSLFRRYFEAKAERMYQVQVWTTSDGSLDESQRAAAVDLLLAVRQHFLDVIIHEKLIASAAAGIASKQSPAKP